MKKFGYQDLKSLEFNPKSPISLRQAMKHLIVSSTHSKARVESINTDTGEYRVVLHGTLEREEKPNAWDWA